jgi:hypothetical protein
MRYILEQNSKVLTVGTSIFEVSDEIKPPILNLNAETLLLKPNGDARINSDPISIWYSNNMQGISAQQPEAAKQPLFRPNAKIASLPLNSLVRMKCCCKPGPRPKRCFLWPAIWMRPQLTLAPYSRKAKCYSEATTSQVGTSFLPTFRGRHPTWVHLGCSTMYGCTWVAMK